MGEARRRKLADPENYGKNFHIGCYLDKSDNNDTHAVYLGVGRKGLTFSKLIWSHTSVTVALEVLGWCETILEECGIGKRKYHREILKEFMSEFIKRHGEEEIIKDFFTEGIRESMCRLIGRPYTKIKKSLVVCHDLPNYVSSNKRLYGDPEGSNLFNIAEFNGEEYISVGFCLGANFPFKSYFVAAYIADYLNENNTGSLSIEELEDLTIKAETLLRESQ